MMQITIDGKAIEVDEECAGCVHFYDLICHAGGFVYPYHDYYKRAAWAVENDVKCGDWQDDAEEVE